MSDKTTGVPTPVADYPHEIRATVSTLKRRQPVSESGPMSHRGTLPPLFFNAINPIFT